MASTRVTKTNPETAVREYLLFLADPNQLRDDKKVQACTTAVLNAKDPIDKLKALAALEKVASVDEDTYRGPFVQHVKAWAEELRIPVTALREMKVPVEVLREAGFSVAMNGTSKRRDGGERMRAKAVPIEDIKRFVLSLKGTKFQLVTIADGVGGSQATIRKALDELMEAGSVNKLGPVPNYEGRGRAPLVYEVVS